MSESKDKLKEKDKMIYQNKSNYEDNNRYGILNNRKNKDDNESKEVKTIK